MLTDKIHKMRNSAENLVFSAAFDDGNEKLYEVWKNTGNIVSYTLRRNTYISDNSGNELWNESQQNFATVAAYLGAISKQLATYTPIELDHRFSEIFKDRLLQSVREFGIEGERKMFNLGIGFSLWSRWLKVFGSGTPNEQGQDIVIHNFIAKEPIRKIQIETSAIRSFQDMLNRIYAAMLPTAFQTGQYGKGWILFNLSKSVVVENANRRSLPAFAAGDQFAVLRLVGNGG